LERTLLIRDAEIGGQRASLRCKNGLIVEISDQIEVEPLEEVIDAKGGVLLPGLHDHHLHLFSLAAQLASLNCGPPSVTSVDAFTRSLREAEPSGGWLRGTGYFESVAGPLDRNSLDTIRADVPIRIQHRSGSMWFLNSRAIEALQLDTRAEKNMLHPVAGSPARTNGAASDGNITEKIERDAAGRATGRLFRADDLLRQKLHPSAAPDLAVVGSQLARYGVTRVTDATPATSLVEAELFRDAQQSGALPQRLRLMGGLALSGFRESDRLEIGELKIMLDEPALPELDHLTRSIEAAHAVGRRVAIHTVTRTEIYFALAAFDAAGPLRGDRLEHASVAPDEALERTRQLEISIVTQPNFVGERGDDYRETVGADDLHCLYRVESWRKAGVPLAAGTDAPFGDPDPWRAMSAAVKRRTASGACLGPHERVSPEVALGLFRDEIVDTGDTATSPFGPLAVGQKADLCLLNSPWREAREELSSERVVATLCAGNVVWQKET
jgi:predicted amidohydrolase YtcJ